MSRHFGFAALSPHQSFATFCGLVAGLAGQVRRRTVVGMLGGGLQHVWPHDRAHYFFPAPAGSLTSWAWWSRSWR